MQQSLLTAQNLEANVTS